jgi:hypothetical protein
MLRLAMRKWSKRVGCAPATSRTSKKAVRQHRISMAIRTRSALQRGTLSGSGPADASYVSNLGGA